ncbi:hypothetical protein scyTo_0015338 [Scyliorhinus torazame]|uniref:Uncharacterized protein n=1 Tax=Scyliorhinus torazame TaxID=75743 RepID=A0A401PQZ3_SCYTO|nr:hypothetical protein [Scyliorhinus torazame]
MGWSGLIKSEDNTPDQDSYEWNHLTIRTADWCPLFLMNQSGSLESYHHFSDTQLLNPGSRTVDFNSKPELTAQRQMEAECPTEETEQNIQKSDVAVSREYGVARYVTKITVNRNPWVTQISNGSYRKNTATYIWDEDSLWKPK